MRLRGGMGLVWVFEVEDVRVAVGGIEKIG